MNKSIRLVLSDYAQRLIESDARTRSFYLSKVNNKYCVDIVRFAYSFIERDNFQNVQESIDILSASLIEHTPIDFIYRPYSGNDLSILFSSIANNLVDLEVASKILVGLTEKEFLTIQGLYSDSSKSSKKSLGKTKNDLIQGLEKKHLEFFSLMKDVLQTSRQVERQYGKNDLYLGYPFIEGLFVSGKPFRAPILLYKVSCLIGLHKVHLEFLEDAYINPVFVQSYLIENNEKFMRYNFSIDAYGSLDALNKFLKEKLEFNTTKIDDVCFKNLLPLIDCTKNDYIESVHSINQFVISYHACFGLFPISGSSIFDDCEELASLDNLNLLTTDFLYKDTNVDNQTIQKIFGINKQGVIHEDKFVNITPLDFTQKMILEEALFHDERSVHNLVIQGPPGTGKSQTIVNLALNYIIQGKKVLLVSEKKSALDVVYNRLGMLNRFAICIVDVLNSKKEFYEHLKNAFEFQNKVVSEKDSFIKTARGIESFFIQNKLYSDLLKSSYRGLTIEEICKVTLIDPLKNKLKDFLYFAPVGLDYLQFVSFCETNFSQENIKKYDFCYNELTTHHTYQIIKSFDKIILLKNSIFNGKDEWERKTIFDKVIRGKKPHINLFDRIKKAFHIDKHLEITTKEYTNVVSELNDLKIEEVSMYQLDFKIYNFYQYLKANNISRSMTYLMYQYQIASEYLSTHSDTIRFFQNYEQELKDVQQSYNDKIDESFLYTEEYLEKSILSTIEKNPQLSSDIKALKVLSNQIRKKALTTVFSNYSDALFTLFPLVFLTPDVVSTLLPLKKDMFDVVIFDEASQMFIERSIPSIYRSKQMIVAGDEKQLSPSSLFSVRLVESIEDIEYNDEYDELMKNAMSAVSLLSYAKTKYAPPVILEYHYRSESKDLIEFSNRAFYDSQLVYASLCHQTIHQAIEVIDVDGVWDNNKNIKEAETVVSEILNILVNRTNNETIGVITFNAIQQYLIQSLFQKYIENKLPNYKLLEQELIRQNDIGEEENLFVKNIENVQGDERDIILFSVGYGKNPQGVVLNSFGSLNMPGGENRLNVAITRAKEKIYIIKSVPASSFHPSIDTRGAYLLQKYLVYAECITNKDEAGLELVLNDIGSKSSLKFKDNITFTNTFASLQTLLRKALEELPYKVCSNYSVGSFQLDFAIQDTMNKEFVLAIILDGAYLGDSDAIYRDYYRGAYLNTRGWRIYRVWSINYWLNPILEIHNIVTCCLNQSKIFTLDK